MREGTAVAGRYRLLERVGAGGMGEVWRAADELLGRTVAVKVVLPAMHADTEFVRRFLAEARAMASVHHPGVVAIHDFGATGGSAYIVMEYVAGEPLSQTLQRAGRLTPASTMELVSRIAQALQAVHNRGVVHRDIKPSNLMVRPDGSVALADFGIAVAHDRTSLTQPGQILGTPSYLAPEQVLGRPASTLSDVYALGLVAYECLAGRKPFSAEQPLAVALQRVQQAPPQLPPDVPPQVANVVMRALAAEPSHRWPSAAEFALAADRALKEPALPARGSAPAPAQNPMQAPISPQIQPPAQNPMQAPIPAQSQPPMQAPIPAPAQARVQPPMPAPTQARVQPPMPAPTQARVQPPIPPQHQAPIPTPAQARPWQSHPAAPLPVPVPQRQRRKWPLAVAAAVVAVLVGAGATLWATGAFDPKAITTAQTGRSPGPAAPKGFVACGAMLCPVGPMCWRGLVQQGDRPYAPAAEDCAAPHYWETFAAMYVPDGVTTNRQLSSLMDRTDVAQACSARAMSERSRNPAITRGWRRDAWPIPADAHTLLVHCLAGSPGGESPGAAFRSG